MHLIKRLLQTGILKSGDQVRTRVHGELVEAVIDSSGDLIFKGMRYPTAEAAMRSILGPGGQRLGGSALQFWTWFDPDRGAWVPLEHARAQLESRNRKESIKTSATDPLRIDAVAAPGIPGLIGMTICPGKQGSGLYAGEWQRDLNDDLSGIARWGGQNLVTLLERSEFELLGVPNLGAAVACKGLNWVHLPIRDMTVPDSEFELGWAVNMPGLFDQLRRGLNLVVHCRGGLGRSGLVAARMLIEMGEEPRAAIKRVRLARERAIETYEQEEYLLCRKWE